MALEEAKTWEPSPTQSEFISIPDSISEGLFGGQAGGGKTDTLLNLPLARTWQNSKDELKNWIQHPRFKGIIFRRTFPELEREIIARAEGQGFYKAFGCSYNKARKRIEHEEGGILAFGHAQYDADIKAYDSDEYNYIAFDELTTFSEYQYLYMFSRNRTSSPELPSIMRSGTNPGGVGNLWVRERFVEPARAGRKIIYDKITGTTRIFIPSRLEDNPHIVDPEGYRAKLLNMPEKDRKAKLEGDWYSFGGQVFTEYRDVPIEGEPKNACHVVEPFQVPLWWPRILAVDWGGGNAETVALWGALAPSGRFYVYREHTWAGSKINEWATDLKRISSTEIIKSFVLCRSAWQERGDPELISQQVEKYSGLQPKQSDSRRIAGRYLLHEFLRWKPRPPLRDPGAVYNQETADAILRTQGTSAYKDYVKSFDLTKTELDEELPKLLIFAQCTRVRQVIPLCVTADDDPQNVAEFKEDDPYDTLRYLVMEAEEIRLTGLFEKQTLEERRQSIVQELKVSGDQTSYFMRMRALERKEKNKVNGPIKKFHPARRKSRFR